MKILLTGSRGRLGTEIKKHIETVDFEGDITKSFIARECDLVIHCAAYTDVFKAEVEPMKCIDVNVKGTYLLTQAYQDKPFVYISTEYAKNPLGIYAWSKALGEKIVEKHPHHLIIRTLFKPKPWPFHLAYEDQYTTGDYIDVITEKILEKIKLWNKKDCELWNIGTGRKSMYQLALQTRPDVKPNWITEPFIPKDYI